MGALFILVPTLRSYGLASSHMEYNALIEGLEFCGNPQWVWHANPRRPSMDYHEAPWRQRQTYLTVQEPKGKANTSF
uniref:Uncharacterized protein n=1 Tax=Coccidioides posadasii RMSCC 3488 TaxID=454284 RepID=A0A0J6IHU2_COCPO|nr:hypothetical protein CPAG_07719 [Coccidioides posadasii RMSCC 3488]